MRKLHRTLGKFYQGLAAELILYVRHSAWLHAVPKKADGDKSKAPNKSRIETLNRDGIASPEMPPCAAMHIADWLFEVGPTISTGGGSVPLSHTEIEAWQHNTGITLDTWQARMLKRLSYEYLNELHAAADTDRPAPWAGAAYAKPKALLVAMRLKQAIAGLGD